ncbi:uncharacterized protein LOC107326422 [Python bivittatus]|uniref:Uncharacterized protein LOC107326422 n=1 Tax=Python bivittatus TaxID=176946 RepID=A0A9F5IQT9_PYTBI|nr:uncharacterized protein LOC107326422 [Python bivittatus]
MTSVKRKCKFSDSMKSKYPCFVQGRNENEAKCLVCDSYLSIANKGSADLRRHVDTEKHMVRGSASSSKIASFFQPKHSAVFKKVLAAEATLAFHTVTHLPSYESLECATSWTCALLGDAETAKDRPCARTKMEAIINHVIAPHTISELLKDLRDMTCFGISTDASNHGAQKIFPLVLQYFDWKAGGIQTKVLELDTISHETPATISQYLWQTLAGYELSSKCVAFAGDTVNVNFGGVSRKDGKNVFSCLKENLNQPIVAVGCPVRVLHNCIQHGADLLKVDVEAVVLKIFNYFSVYTVRTESLKDFCEYIDINYHELLSHTKTRWLSLFPAIEALLEVFPALQDYFRSVTQPPVTIQNFFENDFADVYVWFLHSLMSVFQGKIAVMEREALSVIEVVNLLQSTVEVLKGRLSETFMSLKVRELVKKLHDQGLEKECEYFTAEIKLVYEECIKYLERWLKPLDEFHCFSWMCLDARKNISFDELLPCILYLKEMGITVDDVQLFDQYCRLKIFVKEQQDPFFEDPLHVQWCSYFRSCKNASCFSELLKICEFFFCVPGHNANVERVFSLINAQWTKERNQLSMGSVKGNVLTKYNMKNVTCEEFYAYVLGNEDLLDKVGSFEKY